MSKRSSQHMLSGARALLMLCAIYGSTYGHAAEEHDAELKHQREGRNEISISVGVVHEGGETDSAAGLEYERRFSDSFGAGLLLERGWGDHTATIYALPLIKHVNRWKFFAAPGVEDGHTGSENLLRVGAGYELDAGTAAVTPVLALDFVGGEKIYIFSIALGFDF